MNHLDDGGKRVVVAPPITAGIGRQDKQRGAQALAAAPDDVFGDLPDQHDVGGERVAQHAIDLHHLRPDGRLQKIEGHGGGGGKMRPAAFEGRYST